MSDKDIVAEAKQQAALIARVQWSAYQPVTALIEPVPELLRALADEVERLREIDGLLEADDIRGCDKCDLCEDHHG